MQDGLTHTLEPAQADGLAKTALSDDIGSAQTGTAPTAPTQRKRIGRFTIQRELGRGGMGAIFAAHDDRLERDVAIKVLHHDGPDARQRLVREAKALAKLQHPNVVTIFEVGEENEDVYIVMEMVHGRTLRDCLKDERDWQSTLALLDQAGRGLAAAHRAGLVHRDFKPDNVMVDEEGRCLVLDFGLAKPENTLEAPPSANTPLNNLTISGAVLGTPRYMAPEQFRGDPSDPSTDQFAFALVVFEALYGIEPFEGATFQELCVAVLGDKLVAPPEDSAIPQPIRHAISRALSNSQSDRFPSMDALLAALAPAPPKRKGYWLVAMAMAICIALVALLVPLLSPSAPTSPTEQYASVLAKSHLPALRSQPAAGDETKTTIHRLSNGLTVYISPDFGRSSISASTVFRVGAANDPVGHSGLAHLLERSIRNGSDTIGTVDYASESEHLSKIDALYDQLEATTDELARVKLLSAIERESAAAAKFAIPGESEALLRETDSIRIGSNTNLDYSAFDVEFPSNRLSTWAEIEADRWMKPSFRMFQQTAQSLTSELRKQPAK